MVELAVWWEAVVEVLEELEAWKAVLEMLEEPEAWVVLVVVAAIAPRRR